MSLHDETVTVFWVYVPRRGRLNIRQLGTDRGLRSRPSESGSSVGVAEDRVL